MDLLQSSELCVAVCAPASTIKNNCKRPAAQKRFRPPEHAIAVRQFEVWSLIARFKRAVSQAVADQFHHGAVNGSEPLGWDHRSQLGGEVVELALKGHQCAIVALREGGTQSAANTRESLRTCMDKIRWRFFCVDSQQALISVLKKNQHSENLSHHARQFHPRQLAAEAGLTHVLEHFAHLGVLPEKLVHFLHAGPGTAG